MPTGYAKEVVLGTDPQVRVYIFEDEGNLFFQVEPDDPANFDLDGVFFNLTNDAVASDLVIFPLVNDEAVTGFSANANSENSLSNGATTQDDYDVKVQFGQSADSTSGTVGTGFFTFYLDSLTPLTADDIDLSSLTAVVNSDDGAGQVLLAGVPGSGPVQEIAFEFDPSGVYHPADSSGIASDARWYMSNGKLTANGCYDGALTFEEVDSDGPVTFELTGKINKAYNFENSGWLEDQLHVQVQIDGGHWVTLDTFEVDYHQKALVGTGQAMDVLRSIPGCDAQEIPSGCCGMAGAFGFEKEHYDVSMAIGEQRLFPAVEAKGDEWEVVVMGVSCRQQIEHGTGRPARHLVEVLRDALPAPVRP